VTLARRLRQLNPTAQIIMNSENLADVPRLYREGVTYVTIPRLLEASEILEAIKAAEKGLLEERRKQQETTLEHRREVIA